MAYTQKDMDIANIIISATIADAPGDESDRAARWMDSANKAFADGDELTAEVHANAALACGRNSIRLANR